jgi:hypothetical protein
VRERQLLKLLSSSIPFFNKSLLEVEGDIEKR